jgi:hydroxymethylpyrimidine pyrophosphatase-like HAD family hydrolase
MATYLETGQRRFCHVIDAEIARAAAAAGAEAGIEPFVSTAGDSAPGDALFPPDPVNDGMRYYHDNRREARDYRLRPEGRLEEGLSQRVICLTFVDTHARLLELRLALEKAFAGAVTNSFYENPYSTGWWWLTLQPALGTKAHAVAELAESLGLPIEDVTVFGDYVNDIPMFEAAGRAVAVENAAPEIKEHADEIIGPNTDDSVVKYLSARWEHPK